MQHTDEDRRRYKRFEVKAEVIVQEEARSGDFQFISQNISEGGLLITSDIPFDEGGEYKFTMKLGDETVSLMGRVVWIRYLTGQIALGEPQECGVEFYEITDKQRKQINEYLVAKSKT